MERGVEGHALRLSVSLSGKGRVGDARLSHEALRDCLGDARDSRRAGIKPGRSILLLTA
jgi:hypothetical protein